MAKKREKREVSGSILGLLSRYLILLIIAIILSFSTIFYDFFLKLTIYPTNYLLNFFYSSVVLGNQILIQSQVIEIIPACVATSAYFLFFILIKRIFCPIFFHINTVITTCCTHIIITIIFHFIINLNTKVNI